jgi:hypothetical protein
MHTCPVCAYKGLRYPPSDFAICPSCGTEFGYDDTSKTYEDLRRDWIIGGMRWFSLSTPRPVNWNAVQQLSDGSLLPLITKTATGTSRSESRFEQDKIRLEFSRAV